MKKFVFLLILLIGCARSINIQGWTGTITCCQGDQCTIYQNATVVQVDPETYSLVFATKDGKRVVCHGHWTLEANGDTVEKPN